jgi:hypothetical protein
MQNPMMPELTYRAGSGGLDAYLAQPRAVDRGPAWS